jgi:hypothetical protein
MRTKIVTAIEETSGITINQKRKIKHGKLGHFNFTVLSGAHKNALEQFHCLP